LIFISPSKFRLRGIFRGVIIRVATPLANRGVSPNTITYLTLLFAVLAFLSLLEHVQILYGIFVFLVGFFDGVDGAVARITNRASPFGGFSDSVVDKIAEVILIFSILISYPNELIFDIPLAWWVIICISSWLLTSYIRARAESYDVKDLDIGLGGRSERLFILCVFSLFNFLFIGLFLVSIIGVLTAAYRFHHYSQQLNS
jgi:phosphatidylglycerophosphate synthase